MLKRILISFLAVIVFVNLFSVPVCAGVGDNIFTESEINNSINSADVIFNNCTIVGKIQSQNDVDYFKFSLSENTEVTILTQCAQQSLLVGIADSSGNLIRATSQSSNQNYYYDSFMDTLPAGTYYVVVFQDSDYSNLQYLTYFEYHTHSYTSVETNPTCTEEGYTTNYCSCGVAYYSNYTEALGHSYSSEWIFDVKPTCQSEGSMSHHCTRCDKKTDITVVKPISHQFSDWEILKNATYTSYGQKVRTCDICHSTEYAVIPKLICAAPKLKKVTNTTNGVKITWGKVTGAVSYMVYRKTGSSSWKKIAQSVTSATYTDKTAKAGKNYKYTVRAKSDGGYSKYNTTGLSIKRLTTPTLKSVSSANAGVTFKWSKVTGASTYQVYRKTGNSDWIMIAAVKGNAKTTYLDKTVKKGVTYKYTVKAYYGSSFSAYNTKGLKIKDKY